MKKNIDRRQFVQNTAAISAGLFLTPKTFGAVNKNKKDDINVALLGAGEQGRTLLSACQKIGTNSGIKFKAVCDIWEKGNLQRVSRTLDKFKAIGYAGTAYTDYKEMLDKEKDLDAVIIATPDFWHSEHTVACLKAGLHVYCEKEMSNTLEGAEKMVHAAKETGKLLQIGHQRRSNPRYKFCYEKVIKDKDLLGRITTINGQWNRSKAACVDIGWAEDTEIDEATLNKYGYKSMKQFANWRWYKGLGGGPIVDLGSHQIDIYSWFLGALPRSVMASGGTDYWKDHQWYDNVMAVYEFQTKEGLVRAFYQTLTTNSSNGYFETFMGDQGSLIISESNCRGSVYREHHGKPLEEWHSLVKGGYLIPVLEVTPSPVPPKRFDLAVTLDKPFHQPHLENFFAAVRGEEKLNCPPEIGYETAVMVLKVNEAVEAQKKLNFKPEEFKV